MAKVRMTPIGQAATQSERADANREAISALNDRIQALRASCREGWGPKYQERVHKKGKLTSWERVEALKDPDSPILPIGTFVNQGVTFEGGREPLGGRDHRVCTSSSSLGRRHRQ